MPRDRNNVAWNNGNIVLACRAVSRISGRTCLSSKSLKARKNSNGEELTVKGVKFQFCVYSYSFEYNAHTYIRAVLNSTVFKKFWFPQFFPCVCQEKSLWYKNFANCFTISTPSSPPNGLSRKETTYYWLSSNNAHASVIFTLPCRRSCQVCKTIKCPNDT